MLQYNSRATFPTPSHQTAPQELAATPSPYAGQNHQDIFRGLQQRAAVDLSRYAQQKQDAYEGAASDAQRELALSGLTMMGRARDNAQGAQASRLQMLLRGLL